MKSVGDILIRMVIFLLILGRLLKNVHNVLLKSSIRNDETPDFAANKINPKIS